MDLFAGENAPSTSSGDDEVSAERAPMSVIGAGIVITGDIGSGADIAIDGHVVGDVRCATLIVGPRGMVKGRVEATRVQVLGMLKGQLDTRDLAIESEGSVSAKVTYQRLRVANGATLEGRFRRKREDDDGKGARARQPAPRRERKSSREE